MSRRYSSCVRSRSDFSADIRSAAVELDAAGAEFAADCVRRRPAANPNNARPRAVHPSARSFEAGQHSSPSDQTKSSARSPSYSRRATPSARNSARIVVGFFKQHGFFFLNFRPQQRFIEMLRPQILDRFAASTLQATGPSRNLFRGGMESSNFSPSLAISKIVFPTTGTWPIMRISAGRDANRNAFTS